MKILLLQLKRIGDLILTTPALAALRDSFPDAELTIIVSSECADLLPAISNVNRTLMAQRNVRDLALFFSVAVSRYDYCIDFTRNDRSAFLALLSGARRRAVSYRVRQQSKMRGRAYSDFVSVRMRDMHTIDYNLALLDPLEVRARASRAPYLQLPQVAHEKADALRRDWKITRPYVILHPGSARREKLWEPERWAEVIEHFGNNDTDLVLTSGPSPDEQAHVAAIKNKLQQHIIDLSGKTDLLALAALISQARLLVTVDSAPMHLAAATRTPQVVLFGPTNPFHWRPRESPVLILQGKSAEPVTAFVPAQPRFAMSQISTGAVISAMDSLLSLRATAQSS